MAVQHTQSTNTTRFASAYISQNGNKQYTLAWGQDGVPNPSPTGLNNKWDKVIVPFADSDISVTSTGGRWLLDPTSDQPAEAVLIKNTSATEVFVGINAAASGVGWTVSVGYPVNQNEEVILGGHSADEMMVRNAWAITEAGTATVSITSITPKASV